MGWTRSRVHTLDPPERSQISSAYGLTEEVATTYSQYEHCKGESTAPSLVTGRGGRGGEGTGARSEAAAPGSPNGQAPAFDSVEVSAEGAWQFGGCENGRVWPRQRALEGTLLRGG